MKSSTMNIDERIEALRLARSIEKWAPKGSGHPLTGQEKLARALLALAADLEAAEKEQKRLAEQYEVLLQSRSEVIRNAAHLRAERDGFQVNQKENQ